MFIQPIKNQKSQTTGRERDEKVYGHEEPVFRRLVEEYRFVSNIHVYS